MRRISGEVWGAVGVSLVASGMLAWAIYGSPPYAFFGVMKWVVAAACLYVCVCAFREHKGTAPLGLVLVTLAAIHLLGKMRREDWALFNWAAIGGLVLGAIVLLFVSGKRAE